MRGRWHLPAAVAVAREGCAEALIGFRAALRPGWSAAWRGGRRRARLIPMPGARKLRFADRPAGRIEEIGQHKGWGRSRKDDGHLAGTADPAMVAIVHGRRRGRDNHPLRPAVPIRDPTVVIRGRWATPLALRLAADVAGDVQGKPDAKVTQEGDGKQRGRHAQGNTMREAKARQSLSMVCRHDVPIPSDLLSCPRSQPSESPMTIPWRFRRGNRSRESPLAAGPGEHPRPPWVLSHQAPRWVPAKF